VLARAAWQWFFDDVFALDSLKPVRELCACNASRRAQSAHPSGSDSSGFFRRQQQMPAPWSPLRFARSDLSGYSVVEEGAQPAAPLRDGPKRLLVSPTTKALLFDDKFKY
jgi:hypothetical protein